MDQQTELKCQNCGKDVNANYLVCPYCGSYINAEPSSTDEVSESQAQSQVQSPITSPRSVLINAASSSMFLAAVICYSISTALPVLETIGISLPAPDFSGDLARLLYMIQRVMDYIPSLFGLGDTLGTILSQLPAIITTIGLWMIIVNVKGSVDDYEKVATGLTMVKSLQILSFVLSTITCVIGAILSIRLLKEPVIALIFIAAGALIVCTGFNIVKVIQDAINAADNKISVTPISYGLIFLYCICAGMISLIGSSTSALAGFAMGLAYLFFGSTVYQYKNFKTVGTNSFVLPFSKLSVSGKYMIVWLLSIICWSLYLILEYQWILDDFSYFVDWYLDFPVILTEPLYLAGGLLITVGIFLMKRPVFMTGNIMIVLASLFYIFLYRSSQLLFLFPAPLAMLLITLGKNKAGKLWIIPGLIYIASNLVRIILLLTDDELAAVYHEVFTTKYYSTVLLTAIGFALLTYCMTHIPDQKAESESLTD